MINVVVILVAITIETLLLAFYIEDRLISIKVNTECIWHMCLKLILYCCNVNPKVMEEIYQNELKPVEKKEENQCQEN